MKPETKEGIENWVNHGFCGGFLRAVLENNLADSFSRADEENRADMFEIIKFIYNEIPGNCWGSPEKCDAWEKRKTEEMARKIPEEEKYDTR